MMDNIGSRLRAAREKKGWSQTFVCKKLGIPNSTLSGYERNYRNPDPEMLRTFADLYEVTTDYLLLLSNDPTKNSSNHKKKILTWDLLEGLEKADELTFDGHPLNEKQRKAFIDFFRQILIEEDANISPKNQEDRTQ
jgi:transcriptional regulator with XRE-family HTH domain